MPAGRDYIKQNLICSFLLLLVKFQFPPSKSNYHAGPFSGSNRSFTKVSEQTKLLSLLSSVLPGSKVTLKILPLLTLFITRQVNMTGCFQSYLMVLSSKSCVFHPFGWGIDPLLPFLHSLDIHLFIFHGDVRTVVTWTQKVISGLSAHVCPTCFLFPGTQWKS